MNSPSSGVGGASYSPECEKAVLGAILLGNSQYERIAQIIDTPEAFFSPMHRQLWTVMTDLHMSGSPIDVVLVREELQRVGKSSDHEMSLFLNEVMGAPAFTDHAEYYAERVHAASRSRYTLLRHGETLVGTSYSRPSDWKWMAVGIYFVPIREHAQMPRNGLWLRENL